MSLENNSNVTVSVRVRPKLEAAVNALQSNERYEQMACTALSDCKMRLWDGKMTKDSRSFYFNYDHIFGVDTPQEDLYEMTAVDAVDAVLQGTNASLLTYGQTGSGKTYTVLGGMENNPLSKEMVTSDTGILLRAVEDVLNYADRVKGQKHIVVGISAVEIYLDEIRDLLYPQGTQAPPIQVSVVKEVVRFPNLTIVPLESLQDAYTIYQRAVARRVQRATNANDTSSRSHAIFSIEVFQQLATAAPLSVEACVAMRDKFVVDSLAPRTAQKPIKKTGLFSAAANALMGTAESPVMYSKLTIADLAGSEKAKHSSVKDEGFEQLRKINASLTSLGNVVHSLYENAKHIPYRDSKLTLVLRDAFASPGARIALIVNVSPTVLTVDETLSSLYFADKVKAIKTADVATDPVQAQLEVDYLATLQAFDALVAESHICDVEQEQPKHHILLASARLFNGADNPLVHPVERTAVAESATKKANLNRLCEKMKAAAAADPPAAKLKRFLEEQRDTMIQEYLDSYIRERANVRKDIKFISKQVEEADQITKKLVADTSAMLTTQKKALQTATAERQKYIAAKASATTQLKTIQAAEEKASSEVLALEKEYKNDPKLRQSQQLTEQLKQAQPAQDAEWERLSRWAPALLEVTQLRKQLTNLWMSNHNAENEINGKKPKKVHRKRDVTVEEWLRHAVWAMAGNAVSISLKRVMGISRPDPMNLGSLENLPVDLSQRKYWTQRRLQAEKEERLKEANLKIRKKRYSEFDDDGLADRIRAYLDMGTVMKRVSHDGNTRRRIFYVLKKVHHDGSVSHRLCWDSVENRQTMALTDGLGQVDLSTVSRIILGQSTPAFTACKEAGPATFFRSFSVLYKSKRELKHVDVICESVTEMESWVIGLFQISGCWPAYSDDHTTAPEEDDGMAHLTAPVEGMSEVEAALCRQWYIPGTTFAEAKAQLQRRCEEKQKTVLSVTPGELRRVTDLDIFRASALWLHFRAVGKVENPLPKLHCFVQSSAVCSAGSLQRSSADTAGVTEDGQEEPVNVAQ